MSAPDTNLSKQKERHKGPLIGMGLLGLAVAVGVAYYLGYLAASGQAPDNADIKIDGRTGEEVVIDD